VDAAFPAGVRKRFELVPPGERGFGKALELEEAEPDERRGGEGQDQKDAEESKQGAHVAILECPQQGAPVASTISGRGAAALSGGELWSEEWVWHGSCSG